MSEEFTQLAGYFQFKITKLPIRLRLLVCCASLFLVINHPILGQNQDRILELKLEIASTQSDSAKFFAIDELANLYSKFNFDSAEFFNDLNLNFAKQEESDYYVGHALFRKGANNVFSNQLQEAILNLEHALVPIVKAKDKLLEANAQYYLGNLNYTIGKFSNAIYHYQESLVLSDSLNWPKGRVDNRHNLGGIFFDLEDYELADEYFHEAKVLVEQLNDTNRIPMVLGVITDVALIQEKYAKVDSISRLIIGMSDTLRAADYMVPPSYVKLGQVRSKYKDYSQALVYFFESLNQLNDPDLYYPGPRDMKIGEAYYYIGETYFHLNQMNLSKQFLRKADSIGKNLAYYAVLRDASLLLWQIEEQDENYQKALTYHLNYKTYSDSILNSETVKKILKARINYELEERKKEETQRMALVELEVKQEKQTFYWIIAFIILVLIIVALLLLLQRSRTKREALSKQKVQVDLDGKHRELASYVLQLLRKNELLLEISDKLKKLRKSIKKEQQKELLSIVNSITINSKEIGWEEFELRFTEVHPAFYERLARYHPKLTSNENRLCAFLKLNMTSKEISAFTFQTEHSIIQARSRLKKKLGIMDAQRLYQFISSV